MSISAEQQARDMLERAGVDDAQDMTAGDLVEIATLIREVNEQAHLLGMSGEREARLLAKIQQLEAEIEQLTQALGLLTTLHPTMEIDVLDPLGMAQKIEAHVRAEKDGVPK